MRRDFLKTAIRDENPVVFFEDKMMYKLKGPVPKEEYTIPLGVANREEGRRRHHDRGKRAAWCKWRWGRRSFWKKIGLSAEVIDPRTTWPLDEKTLIESAKKTSTGMVVDEGYGRYGVTGEICFGDCGRARFTTWKRL